jgi:cytochrome c peroxidase
MHTGQFATLRDVVRFYSTLEGAAARGHHGETVLRPLNLTEGEIDDLVAFIETLEGVPPPARLLRAP